MQDDGVDSGAVVGCGCGGGRSRLLGVGASFALVSFHDWGCAMRSAPGAQSRIRMPSSTFIPLYTCVVKGHGLMGQKALKNNQHHWWGRGVVDGCGWGIGRLWLYVYGHCLP